MLLAWGLRTTGPSRVELAQALTRQGPQRVPADDVEAVSCDRPVGSGPAGTSYACRWRQRIAGEWQDRAGRLGVDGTGWRLVAPVAGSAGAASRLI